MTVLNAVRSFGKARGHGTGTKVLSPFSDREVKSMNRAGGIYECVRAIWPLPAVESV